MLTLKHFKKRFEALKGLRQPRENLWKDCVHYLAPNIGCFNDPSTEKKSKRDLYYKDNINTLPAYRFRILATSMVSNLTPSKLRWFNIEVPDETREENIWLKKQVDKMYDVYRNSDLFSNLYNAFLEASVVGTAIIGMQYDVNKIVDFIPMTVGQYYISEGANGFIDTCYRVFAMTAGQIVEKFGINNLPLRVQEAINRDNEDELFNVIHAVEPNKQYLSEWDNPFNKPFISAYFIENCSEDDKFLEYKGLSYFPFLVARWDRDVSSAYGGGIGETVLGDVKSLQKYESDLSKASSKMINPPMIANNNLKNAVKDVSAGSVTYTDDPNGFSALYQLNYNTNEARQNIAAIDERIYRLTYNDLFYMLSQKEKTMSATEASGIMQEKLGMLGSVVDRLQVEFLKPLIDNTFKIMLENGEFDDPPESIYDKETEISYQSALAMSQQVSDLSNVETFIRFVTSLATIDPSAILKLNVNKIVDDYADKMNIDMSLLKTDKEVDQIIAAQQEQQNQQQQAQMENERLEAMAKSAKDFSQADTQSSMALEEMLGA